MVFTFQMKSLLEMPKGLCPHALIRGILDDTAVYSFGQGKTFTINKNKTKPLTAGASHVSLSTRCAPHVALRFPRWSRASGPALRHV